MPSFELRMATAMPRMLEVIRCEMARPAASSFAELMRLPVDRRSIAFASEDSAILAPLWALKAEILVLITVMAISLFPADRKSVVYGKSVNVSVELGGRRFMKQKQNKKSYRKLLDNKNTK